MSASLHDRALGGAGRNRIVAVTYVEGGAWCPFTGGIVNSMKAFCLMTAHGRVWDRSFGGYRPGEIARDNRAKLRERGWI